MINTDVLVELKDTASNVVESIKQDVETKLEEILTSTVRQSEEHTELSNLQEQMKNMGNEFIEQVQEKTQDLMEYPDKDSNDENNKGEDKTVAYLMEELVTEHVDSEVSNAVNEVVDKPKEVEEVTEAEIVKEVNQESAANKVTQEREMTVGDYISEKVEEVNQAETEHVTQAETEQVEQAETEQVEQAETEHVTQAETEHVTQAETEQVEQVAEQKEMTVGDYISEKVDQIKHQMSDNINQLQQDLEKKIEESIRDEEVLAEVLAEKSLVEESENLSSDKKQPASFFSLCSIL